MGGEVLLAEGWPSPSVPPARLQNRRLTTTFPELVVSGNAVSTSSPLSHDTSRTRSVPIQFGNKAYATWWVTTSSAMSQAPP